MSLKDIIKEKEKLVMIMLSMAVFFIIFTAIVIWSINALEKNINFRFAENTMYIPSKGDETYDIDKIYDKFSVLFNSTSEIEVKKISSNIIFHNNYEKVYPELLKFIQKENFFNVRNVELINIIKNYGSLKKIEGNKEFYANTNAEYEITIKQEFEEGDSKFIDMTVTVSPDLKILNFKYVINENLKEYYKALDLSKELNLANISAYMTSNLRQKILVRNLMIKPKNSKFEIERVLYTKNQNQIIINIDNQSYIFVYSKGEIINAFKSNEKE